MIAPVNQTRVVRRESVATHGSRSAHERGRPSPDAPLATPAAGSKPAAGPPGSTKSDPLDAPDTSGTGPLDVTADSLPDTTALADSIARRVQLLAAKTAKSGDVDLESQLRIDQMHAEFDSTQAERAELMREANVLRDMAMEQQKRDDEILKKWISLI